VDAGDPWDELAALVATLAGVRMPLAAPGRDMGPSASSAAPSTRSTSGTCAPHSELTELLRLDSVLFIPAADPPHRGKPLADAATRLAMVRAALEDEDAFEVDDREIRRPGPSYTVLTLEELRREQGSRPLVLLLGMDAFLGLPTWHRWRELLELAHIAVAHRPGAELPSTGDLGRLLEPAARAAARTSRPRLRAGSSTILARSSTSPRPTCGRRSAQAATRGT